MKKIGLIGTHGKTSTLFILESIFLACGKSVAVIGDLGIRINKNKLHVGELSEALELIKDKVEYLFIEIHEDQSVNIDSFECIIVCDFYQVYEEKHYFFYRDLISKAKKIVMNTDNKEVLQIIQGVTDLYIITFGLNNKCTATASAINLLDKRTEYSYYLQRGFNSSDGREIEVQEIPVEINLIGYQNISNSLGAITAALLYDLDPEAIVDAVKKIDNIPERMEVKYYDDIRILVDCASDRHAFKMLFETLQYLSYENLDIVIAIENIASLLEGNSLSDFINDLPLVKGANIFIIGKPFNKAIDKISKNKLVDGVLKNDLGFNYGENIEFYLNKEFRDRTDNDTVVSIGLHNFPLL